MSEIALVDRVICAAARAWENDGEVLATGIGLVPRLAASLCMRSINTDLIMTDSEAWVVNEPVPVGPRGDYKIKRENWMGFSRIFDNVWGGKRHAMVGPVQVDRFGQGNISMVGSDYARPKSMMLGVRGFPGNSINHANSFFVPNHSTKVLCRARSMPWAVWATTARAWPRAGRWRRPRTSASSSPICV